MMWKEALANSWHHEEDCNGEKCVNVLHIFFYILLLKWRRCYTRKVKWNEIQNQERGEFLEGMWWWKRWIYNIYLWEREIKKWGLALNEGCISHALHMIHGLFFEGFTCFGEPSKFHQADPSTGNLNFTMETLNRPKKEKRHNKVSLIDLK